MTQKLLWILTLNIFLFVGCGSDDEPTTTTNEDTVTDTNTTSTDSDSDDTDSEITNENLSSLLRIIPSELVIASNTASATDENTTQSSSFAPTRPEPGAAFEHKREALEGVLSDETIESGSISDCIAALPSLPDTSSPVCYGPTVDYTNHPDYVEGDSESEFSPSEDGQLPVGDLGLWVESEPGTDTACSAAKLNDLVSKAAYNVDLAIGSMAMMVCAAAIEEEDLPETEGESIDLTDVLSTDVSVISITAATITRENFDDGSEAYTSHIEGTITSSGEGFVINLEHSPESETGLLQLERGSTQKRGVSVVYTMDEDNISYKLISAQFQGSEATPGEVVYADDGQITLISKDDIGPTPITEGNDGDVHVMIAEVDAESGHGHIAYGWNAGGRDDHYRVLNVMTFYSEDEDSEEQEEDTEETDEESEVETEEEETDTESAEGHAYYGYAPSPSDAEPESLNLDLSETEAGMICNWAGPGNSHDTTESLQYQELVLEDDVWTAQVSNILYAPTTNCDLDAADSATFTPTDEIFDGEGSLSGDVTNDLWSKTGTFYFEMPTPPEAP